MAVNIPIEQARIYVPQYLDQKFVEAVSSMHGVIEVRNAFALPVNLPPYHLERVWHVEYEMPALLIGRGAPSPKFHGRKVARNRLDEVVQFRAHPSEGETSSTFLRQVNGSKYRVTEKRNYQRKTVIFTTSYSQSKLPLAYLKFHGNHTPIMRIYDGQHPISRSERGDGHVVLVRPEGLDGVVRVLRKAANLRGISVTRETEVFGLNSPIQRTIIERPVESVR